jgi:hypothetical protein
MWIAHRIGLAKYADDEKTEWWMSWGFASQEMTPSKFDICRVFGSVKRHGKEKKQG